MIVQDKFGTLVARHEGMKAYWYAIHRRALETVGTWMAGAPLFTFGELTLDLHKADVAALNDTHQAQIDAEMTLALARIARNMSYGTIADLCTRGCQMISGSLTTGDPLRDEVRHVRGVRKESQGELLAKGRRLVSLWEKVNARRAALTPAQAALLVGTTALGDFEPMLQQHSGLLQSVEDMLSAMKDRKVAMRTLVTRLDENNKRWFQAWKGNFPTDSLEREMLRNVRTGPKRHEPARAVVLTAEVLPDGRVQLAFDALRGTSFTVLHRGPGEPEFAAWPVRIQLKTLTTEPLPPGEHAWKVIAHNSVGDGPESAVLVVKVAARVAA